MNSKSGNKSAFIQTCSRPGFPCIRTFPNSVTKGYIAADGFFTTASIDRGGVAFRYCDGTHGSSKKSIRYGFPGLTCISRLPNPSSSGGKVIGLVISFDSYYPIGSTSSKRTYKSPLDGIIEFGVRNLLPNRMETS